MNLAPSPCRRRPRFVLSAGGEHGAPSHNQRPAGRYDKVERANKSLTTQGNPRRRRESKLPRAAACANDVRAELLARGVRTRPDVGARVDR